MRLQIEIAGRLREVELILEDGAGRYRAVLDGVALNVEARLLQPGVISLLMGNRAYRVVLEEDAEEPAIHLAGKRFAYRIDDPRSLKSRRGQTKSSAGPKTVKATMPGRVVRVLAAKGDTVEANQGAVVIEAMKMQNELKSPKAGVVADVRVAAGDTVALGDVLIVVE